MTSGTAPSPAAPERRVPGLTPAARERLRALFRVLGRLSPGLAARVAFRLMQTPIARPIGPGEAAFLATARQRRLPTPHGEVQAYEWAGQDPAAPTVLIVHGWVSHAARLAATIHALRERDLRVLAFDAPGHGRSGGRRVDADSFRDAIRAMVQHFGPVHGVVAHSFGAFSTARWLAEDAPPALRTAVLVGLMSDVGYVFDSFASMMALEPRVLQRFRTLFHARYGGHPEDFASDVLLRRLRLPVLLVHGALDDLVPAEHSRRLSAELADGQLLVLDDHGHGTPLRHPETAARIAGFLADRLRP
jgi:pimeloyl-ACP methyl ester carboxylesterase